MKTGIVCEGGGMRGIYTSGVLQAFMDAGFAADELVGVSAGASNGASYVSGQAGRGLRTNIDYAGDKRYLGIGNYLHTGSVFGWDFIFGDIPDALDPFDFSSFAAASCDYYAGATDLNTGKAVFFGKDKIARGLMALRASCSIPMLAPIVEWDGGKYLDGGVAAPIPVDKALADGCERLIVILTRAREYRKKPMSLRSLYRHIYKEYPLFVRAMAVRHLVYNHTLEHVARLEAEGRALVVAPEVPLPIGRLGQNQDKLMQSYTQGMYDGQKVLERL